MVVVACRDEVGLETGEGRAGGALADAIKTAAAFATSGGTTPCLEVTARVPNARDWEREYRTEAAAGAAGAV